MALANLLVFGLPVLGYFGLGHKKLLRIVPPNAARQLDSDPVISQVLAT